MLADLVRLGGVLDGQMRDPVRDPDTGKPTGLYTIVTPNPTVMAMAAGRRELALELLALAALDPIQLSQMMETDHDIA